MTILGNPKFCDGGVFTIIDDNWTVPTGEEVAKWLHRLSFNRFCDVLQSMVDEGYMNMDKADKTYNAYADNNEQEAV